MNAQRSSPTANALEHDLNSQDIPFGDNLSESDYGFDNVHQLSQGVPLGPSGMDGDGDWTDWTTPGGITDEEQAFVGPFDSSVFAPRKLDAAPVLQTVSVTSHPAELAIGRQQQQQQHRRIGSNGFASGQERHSSIGTSDAATPNSQRGRINSATDHNDGTPGGGESGGPASSQTPGEYSKADDVPPPAWSELKTKAGKDRKRLPLACVACRRKKIRCSGEKPACKHCLRSRIPCVYKVTTRKAAPRTDYMAMLDRRLKRMEERVIRAIPKDDQGVVTTTGRAALKPPLPPAPPKSAGVGKKRAVDQAFGDDLDEWASARPPDPVQSEQNKQSTGDKPSNVDISSEHGLLQEGADKLPPKELQEHLAEVFFDYVYGQSYHLLHRPSFMRKLAQGEVPPVLVLAICAISARFSNHPAVRTEPAFLRGEAWAAPARDIALKRYDTPNITILIAYMILGLHEFGTCQGGRSWMLSGMALRMAYALQLHRDLSHDPTANASDPKAELSPTDREIRRRTMWACFLMDRFCSSGTERPIFVGAQYISAQLPIKEKYYQMEITGPTEDLEGRVPNAVERGAGLSADPKENMGVAAYVVRLVALWGRLIHYMNLGGKERDKVPMWEEMSKFSTIRKKVNEWKDSLPPSLHYNAENLQTHASERIANQFLFMHIAYHQVLLFMHRFALSMPGARPIFPPDMPEEFITDASRTARASANSISALVHEAMDHLVVVPFVGYAAFFSSTVHIQGAFSKNAQLEASSKQNLAWNVKYLSKIKRHWGMFHFVTESLRELYRKHADAARSGANGKDVEPTIFQYGDWFDRYPHGVVGTDYEGPGKDGKKELGSDAVLGQKSDLQTVEEFFAKLNTPSKAVQLQQQQQQQHHQQQQAAKRVWKRRRSSKTEATRPRQGTLKASTSQQQDVQAAATANPTSDQAMHDPASAGASHGDANPDFHYANVLPPGLPQAANPLAMNYSPQQLQQQSYFMQPNGGADLDILANKGDLDDTDQQLQSDMNQNLLGNTGNLDLGAFDFDAFGSTNQPSVNNFWGDQSNAWFMPFNLDPPTIGADNNLQIDNYDWTNAFSGFGDGNPGILPSTLGTQQNGEASNAQIMLDGDANLTNLDAMEHLR